MLKSFGYAAASATTPLAPHEFVRRDPGADDVQIEILYCGVCHSDLHVARNEWGGTVFPSVPGHEIIGRVTQVGKDVTKFKVGDRVGVGCMVDSCQSCASCKEGDEQYCEMGFTGTYGGVEKVIGGRTFGGYSNNIVVKDKFVLRIPESLDAAGAAPLLCAGVTTWSPLRHWKIGKGHKVGVVGLGGLGHMAIKLAHAMGAHVTLFTTSPGKEADAKRMGADAVVISKDKEQMKACKNSLDYIINTVAASHNLDTFLGLLKRDGNMTLVGVPEHPHPAPNVGALVYKRRSLSGSLIGSIAETQEMLDFCAEHKIVSDIEIIPIQKINEAYDRMIKSDVKYRFVIDMATLKPAA
ncbi:MAG: NAD(P)-dependent alcohol dehydrogenase [Pseudomonadota bacterium]